jgi:glyoxylase-like metal-dependent hydrolase (beta-lactamase superfamily II)
MESLEKLEHLKVSFVFPAHGEYIIDLESLIAGYRTHHKKRTEEIRQTLKNGVRSIYELMKDVFPGIEESEAFLAVSEIIVHLELLIEAGNAELVGEGPPESFHAS